MAQGRKTTEELIAEEERKSEQVKARMAELRVRQRTEERRRDTHRKIVAGATLMAHVKIDPRFRKAVQDAFNKAITDPKRRSVIPDLLDEQAFTEAVQAAATEAANAKEEAEQPKQPAPPERGAQRPKSVRESEGPALE